MVILFQSYILMLGTNFRGMVKVAEFARQTFSYFFLNYFILIIENPGSPT